jgi:hypothetical protein
MKTNLTDIQMDRRHIELFECTEDTEAKKDDMYNVPMMQKHGRWVMCFSINYIFYRFYMIILFLINDLFRNKGSCEESLMDIALKFKQGFDIN